MNAIQKCHYYRRESPDSRCGPTTGCSWEHLKSICTSYKSLQTMQDDVRARTLGTLSTHLRRCEWELQLLEASEHISLPGSSNVGAVFYKGAAPDIRRARLVREKQSRETADRSSPTWTPQHGLTPCLLYTSPSPRDRQKSRMPSSA